MIEKRVLLVECLWRIFQTLRQTIQQRYCVYCSRPDGEMQSFEEKKESLTKFIVKRREQMKTLPGKLQKIWCTSYRHGKNILI